MGRSEVNVSRNSFDIFDAVFRTSKGVEPSVSSEPESEPPNAVAGEPHAKLKRNLDLALDRHGEIMSRPITEDTDQKDRRLAAEVATATIKAANSADKNVLRAHKDDVLKRLLLRVLIYRWQRGELLGAQDLGRLRSASRAEIEAALGPRQVAEFDAAGGLATLPSVPTIEQEDD
jgi:hypothetical protein